MSECLASLKPGEDLWNSCDNKSGYAMEFYKAQGNPQFRNFEFRDGSCLEANSGIVTVQKCNLSSMAQNFLITTKKSPTRNVPKIVWSFWDKGVSKMPEFYQVNIEKWKEVLGNDWQIRVVDTVPGSPYYYEKFIPKESIPTIQWIAERISKSSSTDSKLTPAVVFSDFIRLELLHRHGGVWMDPSIMLHKSLESLTIPLEMFGEFEVSGYTTKHQSRRMLNYADSLENFFIVALEKSDLIREWKNNFRKYWNNKKPGMPAVDNPLFHQTGKAAPDFSRFKDLMNYLNQHLALKFTLEQNPELMNRIFLMGGTFGDEDGPFSLISGADWNDQKLMNLSEDDQVKLMQQTKSVIMSKFASENSRTLRTKGRAYFFDRRNIFGKLNSLINPVNEVSQMVSRNVWTFWDRGEQAMPAFNRFNVMHWRKILGPLGYKITVVNLIEGDPNNLETILGGRELLPPNWDMLDSVVQTYQSPDGGWVKMAPSVVKSDFARLALLEKFGGVWMDSSNVLIKNLDQIVVDALNKSKEHEVGGYIMDHYSSKNSPVVDDVRVDGMENWFIAAKAHSPLIREWREAFTFYWMTRKKGEQIHKHPMYFDQGFDFGGLGISSPNYLNQHAALKYVLHHQPELGQKILPVKHMQPWWFHAKVGGNSADLYRGFISENVGEYAKEIRDDNVELLKFAGPHLTEINQHFRHLDDFCKVKNLLTELYHECPQLDVR